MIKHICPFCNNELSFDSEGMLNYYTCTIKSCKLATFSRCEFNYLNDEIIFRSIIIELNSNYYKVESSYLANFICIERLEKILSKSMPDVTTYLPITVFKVDNFVINPRDNADEVLKILKRFLNLKVFL